MNIRKAFLLLGVFSLSISLFAQRTSILLNKNWNFRLTGDTRSGGAVQVNLPHTWNAVDVLTGQYYRGVGEYEKKLFIPNNWKGKRIFIRFDGAFSVTDVFVNAKFTGEHRGGYAAFIFEITDRVNYGKDNSLLIKVNNAERLDVIPVAADFSFYGGIYRDVHLLLTDSTCISPLDYASPGVYLTQNTVSDKEARVNARVLVSNAKAGEQNVSVKVSVLDGNKSVQTVQKEIKIPANTTQTVEFPVSIKKPHLWNGVDDPFMYQTVVSIQQNGNNIDQVIQPLGLRYFKVDSNEGFFLNGKHIKLHGVCRHQDRAEIGNALLPEHHEEDAALIKEMGVNAVRLAHYQQADYFYHLMDKDGIIVWAELPLVEPGGGLAKSFMNSPDFKENAKQQLKELIRQNYNHPAICMWSLFNEVKEYGDNPTEFIGELNVIAHQEDSTRFTTGASNQKPSSQFHFVTDLLGCNRYYGWYQMPVDGLGKSMDDMHKTYPQLRLCISEYGAGASIYQQSDSLATLPKISGMFHPENWQTYAHIQNWKIINERPYIWGSFIWNMFDFSAAQRKEGDRIGINDKGLVTFDRKVKKDAFYFYKANWNKQEKTLYIAERRNTNRTNSVTDVMVFTNLKQVQLVVNDKVIGAASPDEYGTVKWNGINLIKGENKILVQSTDSKENLKDTCTWTLEN